MPQELPAHERADHLWGYANRLYRSRDYYRAAGEYQRFLFLFPEDPRAPEAELQLGRCYRHGGKSEKAFNVLLSLCNRKAGEPVGRLALLEMVGVREDQGRYPEAIYWTRRFIELYPDDPCIENVYFRLAWLQIDHGDYEQALATLEKIPADSALYPRASSLVVALKEPPRKRKSPRVAGALAAVLPGAGHLYVGRPGEAAASFVINGLFIGAAALAFTQDSPILGGILVFFELGWYQGGIRSAATAARESNQAEERSYREELKQRYKLSFGLVPAGGQMAVALRFDF